MYLIPDAFEFVDQLGDRFRPGSALGENPS
jgi:hypothetical protein